MLLEPQAWAYPGLASACFGACSGAAGAAAFAGASLWAAIDWTMILARRRRALREVKGFAASGGEATMRSMSASRSVRVATGAGVTPYNGSAGRGGATGSLTRRSGALAGRVTTGGTKSTSSS